MWSGACPSLPRSAWLSACMKSWASSREGIEPPCDGKSQWTGHICALWFHHIFTPNDSNLLTPKPPHSTRTPNHVDHRPKLTTPRPQSPSHPSQFFVINSPCDGVCIDGTVVLRQETSPHVPAFLVLLLGRLRQGTTRRQPAHPPPSRGCCGAEKRRDGVKGGWKAPVLVLCQEDTGSSSLQAGSARGGKESTHMLREPTDRSFSCETPGRQRNVPFQPPFDISPPLLGVLSEPLVSHDPLYSGGKRAPVERAGHAWGGDEN